VLVGKNVPELFIGSTKTRAAVSSRPKMMRRIGVSRHNSPNARLKKFISHSLAENCESLQARLKKKLDAIRFTGNEWRSTLSAAAPPKQIIGPFEVVTSPV